MSYLNTDLRRGYARLAHRPIPPAWSTKHPALAEHATMAALVGAAAPAGAQGGGAPATVPAADAGAAPDATTSVDDILAGEEDVLSGTTYSYDAGELGATRFDTGDSRIEL